MSMDLVANVLLSAGTSSVIIHSIEEIPNFIPKAHALYINVEILKLNWLLTMKLAVQVANLNKRPWVLEQVVAGASYFRLKACLELLRTKYTFVRGNAYEIMALFKGSENSNSKVNS
ncbi:Hydroxyethylthiazole kinase [Abeliophyllum distichum]|uniref:hydroxyethylthiazole kinase n=1 Tax=Abeliophyllum distichum TaxID=126358 RepID=A0ABD1PF06_9LAMI